MPSMPDDRFSKAVILICGHDEHGAIGVIINKPLPTLTFSDLLNTLKIDAKGQDFSKTKLHFGGPVEMGRGCVIHSKDYMGTGSVSINDDVALTATSAIIRDVINGDGPKNIFLALGYAGWQAGQLDQEIITNGWLLSDFSPHLLFATREADKWEQALAIAGIRPETLSLESGTA